MLIGDRVLLRPWRDADRAPFADLNADPAVTRFLPSTLRRAESDQLADRIDAHFAARGFGLWALEVPGRTPFAGFVGLSVPSFEADFTPCVEIGWRLARAHWGRGYATEGARLALRHGFEALSLREIVSFTVPANLPSLAVMARLGMARAPETFEHPRLPEGHPLRTHVLHRITRGAWSQLRRPDATRLL